MSVYSAHTSQTSMQTEVEVNLILVKAPCKKNAWYFP